MTKWEYCIAMADRLDKAEYLELFGQHVNDLGNKGWEMIFPIDGYVMFKRKKFDNETFDREHFYTMVDEAIKGTLE